MDENLKVDLVKGLEEIVETRNFKLGRKSLEGGEYHLHIDESHASINILYNTEKSRKRREGSTVIFGFTEPGNKNEPYLVFGDYRDKETSEPAIELVHDFSHQYGFRYKKTILNGDD